MALSFDSSSLGRLDGNKQTRAPISKAATRESSSSQSAAKLSGADSLQINRKFGSGTEAIQQKVSYLQTRTEALSTLKKGLEEAVSTGFDAKALSASAAPFAEGAFNGEPLFPDEAGGLAARIRAALNGPGPEPKVLEALRNEVAHFLRHNETAEANTRAAIPAKNEDTSQLLPQIRQLLEEATGDSPHRAVPSKSLAALLA